MQRGKIRELTALDYLIGSGEQLWRDGEAERPVQSRLFSFEDAVDLPAERTSPFRRDGPIGDICSTAAERLGGLEVGHELL
jgi:hypothetical protein